MRQIGFAGAAELSLMDFSGKNIGFLDEIKISGWVIPMDLIKNVL
jgi:hypothetical protein